MTPEYARELIRLLGTDRVMFGTDYPVKLHGEEIKRLLAVGLEEHELEDIFYNNAKRFLKL
jgi:predicted TIM-barrel fold metal-dependent hydrolase